MDDVPPAAGVQVKTTAGAGVATVSPDADHWPMGRHVQTCQAFSLREVLTLPWGGRQQR